MVFIMVYSLYHPFMVILGMIYYCFTHDPLRAGVRVSRSSMVAPVAAGSTRGDLVAKGWWQWSEQDLAPHISLSTKNTSKGNTARKPQFLKGTFRLVIYIYTFKPNYNYITRPLNDLTYKCIQMCFFCLTHLPGCSDGYISFSNRGKAGSSCYTSQLWIWVGPGLVWQDSK